MTKLNNANICKYYKENFLTLIVKGRLIDSQNKKASIAAVYINEQCIKVKLEFNWVQGLIGRSYFYLVTFDHRTKERYTYKTKLSKFSKKLTLQSEDQQKPISLLYKGSLFRGMATLDPKDIPKNHKFYFQLGQTFGSYDESDTFSLTPDEKPIDKSKIAVVIPCYNVEKFCREVVKRTIAHADHLIMIDDGSTDQTYKHLCEMKEKYPDQVHIVRYEQNQGKGYCLLSGMKYACDHCDFDALITLDSDMQHDPDNIPKLAQAVIDNEDLVIGTRAFSLMPPKSRFANSFITLLLKRVFPHAPHDTQSGYRAFSQSYCQEVIDNIKGGHYEMEFHCLLYALLKEKHIRSIPIKTIYINKNASSHFKSIKDSVKILKTLVQYAGKTK